MYCTSCGNTNWADLRYCPGCGRDLRPGESDESATAPTVFAPAPALATADDQVGVDVPEDEVSSPPPSRWRRWRWPAVVAAVLVVAAVVAAALWPRGANQVADDDDPIWTSVDLGSRPHVAWTRSPADWSVGCASTSDAEKGLCEAEVVGVDSGRMVLRARTGSNGDILVGVSLATGQRLWKRDLPTGTESSCASSRGAVWCVAITDTPQPTPTDGDQFIASQPTGPAQLLALDPATGRTKGSAVLGTSGTHQILGAGNGFVLVGNRDNDTGQDSDANQGKTQTATQVEKYDATAVRAWRTSVPKGMDDLGDGRYLLSADGVDYLPDVTGGNGKGIGFSRSDGSLMELAGGMAVARYNGQIVTDTAQRGGLAIGGHRLAGQQFLLFDQSPGAAPPLVTIGSMDPDDTTSQVHQSTPPYAVERTLPGLVQAFCQGRLVTQSGQVLYNTSGETDVPDAKNAKLRVIDPQTGKVEWERANSPEGGSVCSGSDVAVVSKDHLTGYRMDNGQQAWSVALLSDMVTVGTAPDGLLLERFAGSSSTDPVYTYVSR